MLLPLKDSNPLKVIPFQVVTVAIIAACIAVFAWQSTLGERAAWEATLALGTVPAVLFNHAQLPPEVALIPAEATLVTSMFMHVGWLHLGGNMLYLWVFGDNIEDSMGHLRFVVFYLLCGIAAALTHAVIDAHSTNPLVGASGAVSGVLGAYLVLHPRVRVIVLAFKVIPLPLPAYFVLGGWIVLQFLNALAGAGPAEEGGPAWWAHIGGFVAGVLLIGLMRRKHLPLFDRDRE